MYMERAMGGHGNTQELWGGTCTYARTMGGHGQMQCPLFANHQTSMAVSLLGGQDGIWQVQVLCLPPVNYSGLWWPTVAYMKADHSEYQWHFNLVEIHY